MISLSSSDRETFVRKFTQRNLASASFTEKILSQELPFPCEFWLMESKESMKAGDCVLGRLGASVSLSNPERGYIGFYEVDLKTEDPTGVSKTLVDSACDWLRSKGVGKVYGPVDLTTWFPYRFRINPSEEQAVASGVLRFSWEPTHPPEYVNLFLASGFSEAERYHSMGLEGLDTLVESTRPSYERATELGYSFRSFDEGQLLEREVPILYRISKEGFAQNFLFEEISEDLFRLLYLPIVNRFDGRFCCFIIDAKGMEIGFFFAFLDSGYLVLKSVALRREARGLGLSNAMLHVISRQAVASGICRAITALVRSGARSESYARKMRMLWKNEYAVFEKGL